MPFGNRRARELWARTRLRVWPERCWLASLEPAVAAEAAALAGRASPGFAAVVLERDEVSLTLPEPVWAASPLRSRARAESGPFRVITFDLDLDLDVCGYLAPAAEALAAAGVPIVPQCAFLKDHLLVPEAHLERAVRALEALVTEARG
jgi:hypothetical protein